MPLACETQLDSILAGISWCCRNYFNYFVVALVLLELSNLFLALGDRTLMSKHYVAVKLNVYLCLQYGRILYPLISV